MASPGRPILIARSKCHEHYLRDELIDLSYTHNASPADGTFKLPKGDVLIHAGDLTKQGTLSELRKTLDWIEDAVFEVKLVVAGNHDITLDKDFYEEHGQHFHNQYPQDSRECIDLVKQYRSIMYLNHESLNINLRRDSGPRTSFSVFGSPWSPAHGLWAFGYSPDDAPKVWEKCIPLDTDVVITHTPPKYHCDESGHRGAVGCEVLRQKLWRVRPSLAVCGHVHEGRGAERVLWDLETPNVKYKEYTTGYWTDPGFGNKKQSLIDLSAKSAAPLANYIDWENEDLGASNRMAKTPRLDLSQSWRFNDHAQYAHVDGLEPAVWGQGGIPISGRCDLEALEGRLDRRETCIVNAAIVASSWPYKSNNGRKYNKPIVVDLDLPVREYEKSNGTPEDTSMISQSPPTTTCQEECFSVSE